MKQFRNPKTDPPPPNTRVIVSDGHVVMIAALVDGVWITDAMASNPDSYDAENDTMDAPIWWQELPEA